MIKTQNNSNVSEKQSILEYILLALCLCVLALRTTLTEGPAALSSSLPSNLGDAAYSISVSAMLIFCCIFWFVWGFSHGSFLYRVTGIELGLFVFCAASVLSGFVAADKRLAITNVVTLLTPPLMAVLLSQLLDSQSKVRLVLCVIATLGVVSTCESVYQLLVTNQATIEQYQQAPQTLLEPLGIEPGSFQEFLFEHRLYTRGVHGFFTTRNSAGCFAIMAVFATVALFIDKLKNREEESHMKRENPPVKLGAKYFNPLLLIGVVMAVVIIGLILTRSKGAIIGALFTTTLLLLHYFFADRLKTHKNAVLVACLLLFVAGIWLVTLYGLKHNRLPGGAGMLVRWQYWQGSAKMYVDHPLAGVGPGNFTLFYPRYKPAEALESVADPHNFLLSILTQYGPIGLAGFLAMILIPLLKPVVQPQANPVSSSVERYLAPRFTRGLVSIISMPKNKQPELGFRTMVIIFLIAISAALLLIRPMILPVQHADTLELVIFVILTIYVAPVFAFVAGFLLLSTPLQEMRGTRDEGRGTKTTVILFCTVLGVLLSSLIDYAIFEPGVYTAFWAIIACLIAVDSQRKLRSAVTLMPPFYAKLIAAVAAIALLGVFVLFVWLPVYRSTTKVQKAYLALSVGKLKQAHDLLSQAAEDDPLDETALNIAGKLYLQQYNQVVEKSAEGNDLLNKAEQCFLWAIERNKADFKNYEKLITIYDLMSQTQKAYDWCLKALQLYPCLDRLNFKLAQIAEQLGKTDVAIKQYRKTIEIEDSYRRQFQMIYPERLVLAKLRAVAGKEIVSRLGEEKYQFAIKRVKELRE